MQELIIQREMPDFIVKSTLGVALVTFFLVTPFSLNNFIQGRYFLGFLTACVSLVCVVDALFCLRGVYNRKINLYGVAPSIAIAIIFALYQLGMVGSYWAYMGVLSFYFVLPEKIARVANIVFILVIIPIAWNVLELPVAMRFSAVLIGLSVYAYLSIRVITRQHFMLKQHAVTDSLTGLYNRDLLQESLNRAIQQNHRSGTAMTLIMFDIDHFKSINDELGHDVGDTVLMCLGQYLKQNYRGSDKVFRMGGEEFLLLLFNTDREKSLIVAEKLRTDIEKLPMIKNRPVTVSLGVSNLHADMNFEQWMKRCDESLYQAKKDGRNLVAS